ncbi:MAG: FHA domain-containing protein [Candidatus Competibacteraceae bacterium]
MASIRRCPTCRRDNPATAMICGQCGTSIAHVPLSALAAPPAVPLPPSAEPAPPASPPPAPAHPCPAPDCQASNPPGTERCLYCNTPLTAVPASTAGNRRIQLLWPWGEQDLLNELIIGRDPASSPLASRLEPWDNISRRHTRLRRDGETVLVEDLGSTNGTFLNEERLQPHQPTALHANATLRLAKTLHIEVKFLP